MNLAIVQTMKAFIDIKKYTGVEEIEDILDLFVVTTKVTPSEHAEVLLYAENVYNPPIEIPEEIL